ncbi:endonuclease VII [Mycobacterium phage JuicyJay]|nr:endonuclease VII [Mycobacterium phage NihilNomen]QZD98003.1 endonuclease VII [Mycobacterium phage Beem]UEM46613.1 endonuclease VII [Mycobacterium phage JuicyJay]WNM72678.1 endonuclease VII [Mycobacterium phage Bombitas]
MPDVNRVCIDCKKAAEESGAAIPKRKPALNADGTPVPGNRCITHEREKKKRRRTSAREKRWERVYSISAEQYAAILEAQGGVCAICRRSNGRSRALSVDHDHTCCDGPVSCGKCVRAIICRPCNDFLGWIRDEVEAGYRIAEYLKNPPARKVLDNWKDR